MAITIQGLEGEQERKTLIIRDLLKDSAFDH